VPDLSQSLIRYLLAPENQKLIAETKGWGPTNKKTVLPKELGDALPYGPEKIGALNTVDWNVINPLRTDWTKRWSREIER
jgi:putative spermidine/putrescine transport system substrate-binding protein